MFVGIGIARAEERAKKMAIRTKRGAYVVVTRDGKVHAYLSCHKPTQYVHAIVGANEDGSTDLVVMHHD